MKLNSVASVIQSTIKEASLNRSRLATTAYQHTLRTAFGGSMSSSHVGGGVSGGCGVLLTPCTRTHHSTHGYGWARFERRRASTSRRRRKGRSAPPESRRSRFAHSPAVVELTGRICRRQRRAGPRPEAGFHASGSAHDDDPTAPQRKQSSQPPHRHTAAALMIAFPSATKSSNKSMACPRPRLAAVVVPG